LDPRFVRNLKKKYIEKNSALCLAIYRPDIDRIWFIDGPENIKRVYDQDAKASSRKLYLELEETCHEDAPPQNSDRDMETIEAEVVFLATQAGDWPEGQTEIHFHPSTPEHREIATSIWRSVTSPTP